MRKPGSNCSFTNGITLGVITESHSNAPPGKYLESYPKVHLYLSIYHLPCHLPGNSTHFQTAS